MNRLYIRIPLKFILSAIGIVFLSALPALFSSMKPDFGAYAEAIGSLFSALVDPGSMAYSTGTATNSLFPEVWGFWSYSMTLIGISFACAFIVALAASYTTMLFSSKVRKRITFLLRLLESIPDVFLIGLFTMLVLTIYDHTGVRFFHIIAYQDARIYALPIMALTVLPTLFFYRIMMHDFEAEWRESYVDLAKVKGMNTTELLFKHVFRNAIITFFLHAKSILWFMLSNLLIVEYVFNLGGIMRFMLDYHSPKILAVGLILLFIPIFLIQTAVQIVIEKGTDRLIEV